MSSRRDIEISYDVGNEFYKLWLDKEMNYSCGLHEGVDTEEEAQRQKLAWICKSAHVTPEKCVLDIGCGWGACLNYLITECGVKDANGITLSKAQYDSVSHSCHPGIAVTLGSYLEYKPAKKFDAIISIGMVEHIVTSDLASAGKDIEIYRNFFRLVHKWTNPNTWFGLQLIHTCRIPRNRTDLYDLLWAARTIFPGANAPRMEKLIQSFNPFWEVIEMRTRGEDYAKTTGEWHKRLCKNEKYIRKRWGDKVFAIYDRYLQICVRMFEQNYMSLGQYSLRRLD